MFDFIKNSVWSSRRPSWKWHLEVWKEKWRFQSNWILISLWLAKAMVILLGYLESLFIRGQDAFYLKLIDICNQKIEPNLEGSLFEFCQLKSTSDFSNFAWNSHGNSHAKTPSSTMLQQTVLSAPCHRVIYIP